MQWVKANKGKLLGGLLLAVAAFVQYVWGVDLSELIGGGL